MQATTTTTEPPTTTTTAASKRATITVVKEVPGDEWEQSFLFSLSTRDDFWLRDAESESFGFEWTFDGPKTITVSEHDDLLGEGWFFVGVECVDDHEGSAETRQGVDGPASVDVKLYDGGAYTCTFTNDVEKPTTTTTQPTTTTTQPTTTTTQPTSTTQPTRTTEPIPTTTTSVPFDEEVAVLGIQVTPSTTTTIPPVSVATLPFTGADLGQIALIGLAVLAGGSLLVYGARRDEAADGAEETSYRL